MYSLLRRLFIEDRKKGSKERKANQTKKNRKSYEQTQSINLSLSQLDILRCYVFSVVLYAYYSHMFIHQCPNIYSFCFQNAYILAVAVAFAKWNQQPFERKEILLGRCFFFFILPVSFPYLYLCTSTWYYVTGIATASPPPMATTTRTSRTTSSSPEIHNKFSATERKTRIHPNVA